VKTHIISVLVCFALSISVNLKAQDSGTLTGTVVDAETGETLIGVNVVLEGTLKGTSTDLDGRYTIRAIEPGTYTLLVSYISFQKQTITGVEIGEGETVKLDLTLQPETETLEDVIITADAILDSEAGLLRQRQKAISFSDAISAESISSSGAGDAAGAMKKVVGASVVGGKYVYVRGLGDRYSSTQLNGASLPSADPYRQSFQMDIIPSNLLENIVTLKTFTPDKPGDFSGGLVDITTKDFPENFSFQLSASTSYNTSTSFHNAILPESGSTDWLGFDNGKRALPEMLKNPDLEIPFEIRARRDAGLADTLNILSRSFSNEMIPGEKFVPINQSYSVSIGNQFELFNKTFGYVGSLGYGQSYSSYNDGKFGNWQLIGTLDEAEQLNPRNDLVDAKGTHNVDLNAYGMLSMKVNDFHKISASYLKTQSGSNTGRYLYGLDEDIPDDTYESRVIHYTERSLQSYQFNGKHNFPALVNTNFEWKVSLSENTQEEPDVRYFENYYTQTDQGRFYSITSALFPRPSRSFRDLVEDNQNYKADLDIPFTSIGGFAGKFKTGINYTTNSRNFDERRFQYQLGSNSPLDINDFAPDINEYYDYVGIVDTTSSGRYVFANYIENALSLKNNYEAEKEVTAYYGMLELPLGERIKVIGGIRYEDAFIQTVSADTTLDIGELDNQDYLPSLNLVYSLSENMNIRAAYTNTVARPNYRELAPYVTVQFSGSSSDEGNPDLNRTLIKNYDLRWEWFGRGGEVFAVSGFYKNLKNPIERVLDVRVNNRRTWENVEEATVFGIEVEVRKNLGFITESLRRFSVSSNFTFVESEVTIPEEEMEIIRVNDPDANNKRPLVGQSPFVFNADVSYYNEDSDFAADLNYNIFGDRLSTVSLGATPDIYERSFHSLDLVTKKGLGNNFELKFSASNLLNATYKESHELPNGEEFIYYSYDSGVSFSIGVSYKI
jgi:outer membrane receptor protein involved in Fe transport